MKKICVLLSIITILALSVVLCACGETPAEEKTDNVCYMQEVFYCGKTKDFEVRLSGGIGEAMFVADGQAVDVAPFVTLTLVPLHVDLFNDAYTFVLTGSQGTMEGTLAKDSFGASYTASLGDVAKVGEPTSVTVSSENTQATVEIANMLANSITGTKAMEVAEAHLKDKLSADNKEREVYVKYINDAEAEGSAYYWYVAYIASPTDYYAVLVNDAGKIVSTNP